MRVLIPVLFVGVLLSMASAMAEGPAGLILRLEAGGQSDARHVRSVALHVPQGTPASPFLAPGPFKAVWEGSLVLEKRSRLIFHLEGTGTAKLLIDGEVLVPAIGQPNSSKRLKSGGHEFSIEYQSPAQGDATLRLFWEEREFSREPVPPSAFTHDAGHAGLVAQEALRNGRAVLAQKRCAACHDPSGPVAMAEMKLKGPSLDEAGRRFREDWLAKWIANPALLRPSAHMPAVFKGEEAAQLAADVAAYLAADAPKDDVGVQATPEQIKSGGRIFHEQGCIACHTLDGKGDLERIGLAAVGMKYRHGALAEFLREPARFHEGTRMPTFALSAAEATALAGFLRSLTNDPGAVALKGDAARGHLLAKSSGCFNCHERKGGEPALAVKSPLNALKSADCTGVHYDTSSGEENWAALDAFLNHEKCESSLARSVPAEFAHRQYAGLRCNACHSRDGEQTLREKYGAEVAHLQPPAPDANEEKPAIKAGPPPLGHLGLKLRPEWRTKLFAGEIDPKVRPWMAARMPAFPARAQELSTGFSHAAGLAATSPAPGPLEPGKLQIGKEMVSVQGGLACGTCHGIGDKPPIAVFEGEGPNLRAAGERLTHEYFHLWMTDPPRVWPGTIMPKYAIDGKTPLTQHYEGDARKQFDAIYDYLRSLSQD